MEGTQTASNTAPANVTFFVVNDGTTTTIYTGTPNPPTNTNLTVVTSITVPIPLANTTWTASGGNIALVENQVVPSSLTKPTGADKTAAPLQILPKINGLINVPFYCWPGSATADGLALVPGAVGNIDTVTVTTASTSSSSSSSTSSSSTSSTSSTSTTSTSSTSTTSTTTAPTSTTSTTKPESTTVNGSATYATACTNSVTKDTSNIPFTLKATGPRRTTSGNNIVLTDQSWSATVPSSVLTTAINLGLLAPGQTVQAVVSPNVKGTNTDPADNHAADVAISVGPIQVDGNGDALPATTTFAVSDLTYRATGGDATFAMSTTKMLITIGALKITFTCSPTAPIPVLLTTIVTGPQLPTTTTTTTRPRRAGRHRAPCYRPGLADAVDRSGHRSAAHPGRLHPVVDHQAGSQAAPGTGMREVEATSADVSGEHTNGEVPVDDGRYLPIRREVVAPPRRRATTAGGRRRLFTLIVLVWVGRRHHRPRPRPPDPFDGHRRRRAGDHRGRRDRSLAQGALHRVTSPAAGPDHDAAGPGGLCPTRPTRARPVACRRPAWPS